MSDREAYDLPDEGPRLIDQDNAPTVPDNARPLRSAVPLKLVATKVPSTTYARCERAENARQDAARARSAGEADRAAAWGRV